MRGQQTLAACLSLALSVALVQAQPSRDLPPIKLESLLKLLGSNTIGDKALSSMIRRQCIGFVVDDSTVAELRRSARTPQIAQAVLEACYIGSSIEVVTSDSSDAQVSIDGIAAGPTPYVAGIEPEQQKRVRVSRAGMARDTVVTVPVGRLMRLTFAIRDTVPLPKAPTRSDLEAVERGVAIPGPEFSTKPPVAPRAVGPRNPLLPLLTGAIISGGVVAATARSPCTQDVGQYGPEQGGVRPFLGTRSVVEGRCYGLTIGTATAVGALVGELWSRRSYRSAQSRFRNDSIQYVDRAAAAKDQINAEQQRWNRDNAARLVMLRRDIQAWRDAVAVNEQIRKANSAAPKVEILAPYPIRKRGASPKE